MNMKRNFRNNNGGGNRFNNGGNGGGGRGGYRKHNNHGNQNHGEMGQIGDQEFVHPKQRRHLQAQKDRYVALAREALQRGDRIQAEFFYQHVEHFSRMISLIPVPQQQQRPQNEAGAAAAEGENAEASENNDAAEGAEGNEELAPIAIGGSPSSFYHQPAAPAAAPAPVNYDTDEE